METPNLLDIKIGSEEKVALDAAKIVVQQVVIEPVKESSKSIKAVFVCKHPKREEPIRISSAMIISAKTKKLQTVGTWVNLDSKGELQMHSTPAMILRTYGANNLQEMVGKTIDTVVGEDGYLAIKAYS